MPERTTTAAKAAAEPAARGMLRDTAPPAVVSMILGLQQTTGNQTVGRLLGGALLQPKLRIGPPGDAYEREADRVADEILRGGSEAPSPVSVAHARAPVQRQCHCQDDELVQRECHCQEEKEEELVQPKRKNSQFGQRPGFEARVDALRGAGRPLPGTERRFFEPRFGHDFGSVRVHTGAAASEAADAVGARAFTVGNDVVFGRGEWSPGTDAGKRLLAHELTHVIQQTPVARRKPTLQRAPEDVSEATPGIEEDVTGPKSAGASPEASGPTPTEEPGPEPSSEPAGQEQTSAAGVVVDDDATDVAEGQMKKGEFIARARPEVCAAAAAGFSGTGQSPEGCPFIEFAFTYYEGQSAARLNRDLPRFLGDGPRPTTAAEYISAIAERVRASVEVWSQTGAITGVPRGLLLAGMELPAIQGAGTKVGRGAVQFKARSGGVRHAGDPAAVREALGAGRPLEGGLRSRMESAFGRSFSHVRVHTDRTAASLSDRFNARAFTVGEHVGFGATEYRPATFAGDALIAHELAHVVQQDGAVAASQSTDSKQATLEADADRSAAATMVHLWRGLRGGVSTLPRRAIPRVKTGLRLQRCKKGKCVVKSGPTYTPRGTQTPATSGGNKRVPFDFTAVFEHDPSKDINASCCGVRQNIKWDAAFATHYGKPPHKGFPKSAASGTWHEDRDSAGKRYGHRTGSHSECIADNHYEDSAGSFDCADGTVYKGHDNPGGPTGLLAGVWDFELMVVDVCNDDKQVGASDTLKINW